MSTEFNELLLVQHGDKTWIWIFSTRDQVIHTINEFYVKRIATDFPSETLRERSSSRRSFQLRLKVSS